MDVENLKRQTEQLKRQTERLQAKDRPEPVEVLRLQRRADKVRRKVRRAEELQEMREELEGI